MTLDHKQKAHRVVALRQLMKRRKRFIVCTLFVSFLYFIGLPLFITLMPETMNRPVYRHFTPAWIYAFSQFLMVWSIGLLYYYQAKRFDKRAKEIEQAGG